MISLNFSVLLQGPNKAISNAFFAAFQLSHRTRLIFEFGDLFRVRPGRSRTVGRTPQTKRGPWFRHPCRPSDLHPFLHPLPERLPKLPPLVTSPPGLAMPAPSLQERLPKLPRPRDWPWPVPWQAVASHGKSRTCHAHTRYFWRYAVYQRLRLPEMFIHGVPPKNNNM